MAGCNRSKKGQLQLRRIIKRRKCRLIVNDHSHAFASAMSRGYVEIAVEFYKVEDLDVL